MLLFISLNDNRYIYLLYITVIGWRNIEAIEYTQGHISNHAAYEISTKPLESAEMVAAAISLCKTPINLFNILSF